MSQKENTSAGLWDAVIMTPMTSLCFAFERNAASNPVRYNTESRTCALGLTDFKWKRVLCSKSRGSIAVSYFCGFWMFL